MTLPGAGHSHGGSGVMTESGLLASSPLTYWICLYLLFGESIPVSLAQVRQEHKRMLQELLEPR